MQTQKPFYSSMIKLKKKKASATNFKEQYLMLIFYLKLLLQQE